MAKLELDDADLDPLVRRIVVIVLDEVQGLNQQTSHKMAISEPEAANLLDLHPWQLRDLRRSGRITFRRIVGGRIRYTQADLIAYLNSCREPGTER